MGFTGMIGSKLKEQEIQDASNHEFVGWDRLKNISDGRPSQVITINSNDNSMLISPGVATLVVSGLIKFRYTLSEPTQKVSIKILLGTSILAEASSIEKFMPYLYCQTQPVQVNAGSNLRIQVISDDAVIFVTPGSWFLIQVIA